jgi:NAD/NADP transhydrogenase alpha subunit
LAAEAGGDIETITPRELTVHNNVTHIDYTAREVFPSWEAFPSWEVLPRWDAFPSWEVSRCQQNGETHPRVIITRKLFKKAIFQNLVSIHPCYTDLPSRLPTQASTLHSNNLSKLLLSMQETKDHYILDMADDVALLSLIKV